MPAQEPAVGLPEWRAGQAPPRRSAKAETRAPCVHHLDEDPRAAELLNELYTKEWGWFRNFFCPVMKHLRTEVEGSRKRRVYDTPATPFERLKPCGVASEQQIAALENLYRTLDPFALKEAYGPVDS